MKKYSKYINTFSLPHTVSLSELKKMNFGYAIGHFLVILLLMYFPVMYSLGTIGPYELSTRINPTDTALIVSEITKNTEINIDSQQYTDLISQYIVEINNQLVESGLYQQTLNFVLVGSFFLVLIMMLIFYLIVPFAYQHTRNINSKFAYKDVLKITIFAGTLPAVLCLLVSALIGPIALFLFQMLVSIWLVKFLDEMDRQVKEEVEKIEEERKLEKPVVQATVYDVIREKEVNENE